MFDLSDFEYTPRADVEREKSVSPGFLSDFVIPVRIHPPPDPPQKRPNKRPRREGDDTDSEGDRPAKESDRKTRKKKKSRVIFDDTGSEGDCSAQESDRKTRKKKEVACD